MEFFAGHGLFSEEAVAGNRFIVSAYIDFDPGLLVTKLEHTIDYVTVYKLIQHHMQHPVPLLESLAATIIAAIHALDARIRSIRLEITKTQPPIPQFKGEIAVSVTQNFGQ